MLKLSAQVASLRPSFIWPYLQLLRPANIVTAAADILAGYAVAGLPNSGTLAWLLLSSMCLYAGGVVLNDVCDAALDTRERPERPIPSGRASRRNALLLALSLLIAGIGAALLAGPVSGLIAGMIALAVVSYDTWSKQRLIIGPINMGLCRGLNLLLGISAAPLVVADMGYLAFIPIIYIGAITAVSRGEVSGARRETGLIALLLLGVAFGALLLLPLDKALLLPMTPFLVLLALRVVPPFWRAYQSPSAAHVRGAVQAGVLSLIVLDAAIAAAYAGLLYGLAVLILLFLAAYLARLFAVT